MLKSKVNEETNESTVKTDTPKRKGRKRKGKSPAFETVVEGTKDDRIKQVICEELQKVWAAITDINAKICKKTTEEDSDKEFTDDNETISITISNKFQSLNGINEPSTSIQRTAEIKRLATMEPDQKKIEDELFEERRKVHDLENAMKERKKFISDLNAENETIRERNTRLEQELQLVMKQLADLKCEKSRANENQAENAEADNKKPYSKPEVILTGDSIVRNIHGWMMSRNKSVKVNSFPGATTEDMVSYLNPLINRKLDHILLHVGTNNLATDSPQEIAENIAALTKLIIDRGIECSVSEILKRNDYLSLVGEEVNRILRNILPDNVKLICNDSIGHNHLNSSGVHLNKRMTGALAYNFIQFIKQLDFKNNSV